MIVKIIKIEKPNIKVYTYIDLDKVIAIDDIDSPSSDSVNFSSKYKTFRVYFDNDVFAVDASCYKRLLQAWLILKNKSVGDVKLCVK